MRVSYDMTSQTYFVEGRPSETYQAKDNIKELGFQWNKPSKRWETTNIEVLDRTIDVLPFSSEAAQHYHDAKLEHNKKVEESYKIDSDIEVPKPVGLKADYFPYQKAAIEYMVTHKNILGADEMGLGKTVEVMGYINLTKPHNVLIICPAIAKLTPWIREIKKWSVHPYKIHVVYSTDNFDCGEGTITIINYDILGRNFETLSKYKFDLIVIDESHKLKNPKALRTQFAMALDANKKILLTGTPILNRPQELFTQLKILEHPLGRSYWKFIYDYCYVQSGPYGKGQIIIPNENKLSELQQRLRKDVMYRRLKRDVLPELPPKVKNIVTFDYSASPEEMTILTKMKEMTEGKDFNEAMRALRYDKAFFGEIELVRHEQGRKKVPYVIEYIKDMLENVDKVVVFAHHHDVIEAIASAFDNSVTITGQTPVTKRADIQEKFQNDPECRVFVGNIQAAGIAIDLYVSSNAVFAELDWTPSNLEQAEDRLHRKGQEKTVFIDYLVTEDSIDTWLGNVIVEKKEVIKYVTELESMKTLEVKTPEIDDSTINKWTLQDWEKLQNQLTEETGIHPGTVIKAAKALDNLNPDFATVINGAGYNKIDGGFGKVIAERKFLTKKMHYAGLKMLRKYKYQLLSIFGDDDEQIQRLVNWIPPIDTN